MTTTRKIQELGSREAPFCLVRARLVAASLSQAKAQATGHRYL
jgi:hypothetical protein